MAVYEESLQTQQTCKTCEDTAVLRSSVLACWVFVCRMVYSGQIDSTIHVVFHIYEQAVMEESTGLFITSLCSLFIIHSSCLCPFCIFLSAYPLPYCATSPFASCHHSSSLSSFPCPSPQFPVICGPTPCFSIPSIHQYPPLFYILSAFFPLTLTYITVFFSLVLSMLFTAGRGMDRQMNRWMDRWVDE